LPNLDRLRAAAILGVVAIHATSPLLASLQDRLPGATFRFWSLAALNQAGRFSVPAFFILAGYLTTLHLDTPRIDRRPGDYLKSRLGRLLVPYLTWSILLCLLPRLFHGTATAADLAGRFVLGWTFTGGYFLLALAQLTLMTPFLARLARRGDSKAFMLFSAFFLVTEVAYCAAAYGRGAWARGLREAFSPSLTLFVGWAPFYVAGLRASQERGRLLPWLARHRPALRAVAMALYLGSLWEFRAVFDSTASLGLAASFLKPTSALFAFAACALFLGTSETEAAARRDGTGGRGPLARSWRALSSGSYAIYLMHGSVVLALLGVGPPLWQDLLATPAGPLLLAACGLLLPLAVFGLAERHAPRWARFAMFGR
jgi:membrane-bound acyltransferase YfiQ involved in biofilm formation